MTRNIIIVIFSAFVCLAPFAFAAQELTGQQTQPDVVISSRDASITVTPAPSTVLAPEGLTEAETANLEQQYRFTVRNKAQLLMPGISTSGGEGVMSEEAAKEMSEAEKLYRYFGVAVNLYDHGKLDQAVEILRYISDKRPDDKYIKDYLRKMIYERDFNDRRWATTAAGDAQLLKRQTIKELLRDGIDYYKQKRYDKALLKFNDLLVLDPGNIQAKSYLAKLKAYFLQEARVEDIVSTYEQKNSSGKKYAAAKLLSDQDNVIRKKAGMMIRSEDARMAGAEELLDKRESRPVEIADELLADKEQARFNAAEDELDAQELDNIIGKKTVETALDDAELGLTVEDIVSDEREQERRSRLMTLGSGDIIQIGVRDHPELSGKVSVRLDGNIVLPLVNELVRVNGMTIDEAAAAIRESIKRYVKEPSVVVAVEQYNSKKFYVIDEIGCTPYPITRANLTLRDALFVSDWGSNRALGRVIVMKPDKLHPIIRKVDAFNIIYRGNLKDNMFIEDGDVIYVPLTIASKTTTVIRDSLSPIKALRDLRTEWLDTRWNQEGYYNMFRIPRNAEIQADMNEGAAGIATNL